MDFQIFNRPDAYKPNSYWFKLAREPWEVSGFWGLRRDVFCEEQQIFKGSDEDEHDRRMIPIVSLACEMGMPDKVVGVVRIDEREPGVWYGSRLGVHRDFRRTRNICAGGLPSGTQAFTGLGHLGGGLIYKAVSTAHALGAKRFLATVQEQNVRFFKRLHWTLLDEMMLHGRPHAFMEADMNFYPPNLEMA
jgi:hypothetical protein